MLQWCLTTINMTIISEENIGETSLVYLHQTSKGSQIIYITTLLAVFTSLAALPFIYTTVSVKGTGSMQSNVEKIELLAPSNGRLTSVNLTDNEKVSKGTTLLTIDATLPHEQNRILNSHYVELQKQLHDVLSLLSFPQKPNLQTDLYAAGWQQYSEQLQNAKNTELQAYHVYERYLVLYNKKVVTPAEFEQYKFNYDQAASDRSMITKKIKTQWQTEANQYRNELLDLQNRRIQLNDEEKQYTLKATVNGSIQNLTGLQAGAYVYANQKLGEISPDSVLLAYSYIKPEDIGLIKKGQEVVFQINAFN